MSHSETNDRAVVLLSGGVDSATCCAIAKSMDFEVYAMSFSYGQRHGYELVAARNIARNFSVKEHKIIEIDLRTFGGSSLTSDVAVPKNRKRLTGSAPDIPNTYVPARNTIFLSYALAWAEVLESADIFIGVNAIDFSGYPDCKPEYIKAYETMANLATRASLDNKHITLHTPLIDLTKAQIIQKGVSLGVDYGLTHSCYNPSPEGLSCGVCDSCLIRKQGFEKAGVVNPTRYQV
jgi:7-cyano-7-deazaguanine synthase